MLSPWDEFPDGYSFSQEPPPRYTRVTPVKIISSSVQPISEDPDIRVLRMDFEAIIFPYVRRNGIFDKIIQEHMNGIEEKIFRVFEKHFPEMKKKPTYKKYWKE